MKKLLALSMIFLLAALAGCAGADAGEELPSAAYTHGGLYFSSHEALVEHQQKGEVISEYYYQPKNMLEGMGFEKIETVPGVYITTLYTLDHEFAKQFEAGSYEKERTSVFCCQMYLFEDPEEALKLNFAGKGYEAIEYEGVKYYYFAEYALYSEKLIGHSIAYVNDGDLLYIHMPAIDKVENMLKHAAVEKVYCK